MTPRNRKLKLVLMVNIIAPARISLYSGLGDYFDLLLLHGGTEKNRELWHGMDNRISNARVKRAWGWQIPTAKRVNGRVLDRQYIHITPGLIWHLLRFRPDAIVTTEMGFRTLLGLTYGMLFRKPVWVWWGGTLHTERNNGTARRLLRSVVSRWATHWISYGRTSTEYLLSLGIPRERVLQTQNAVDERCFCCNTKPEFHIEPRPVLLHVGQFIARKGIDLLLHAAAVLQQNGHQFSLLLVGSGPGRPSLDQLVRDLKLQNVRFLSSQKPEHMSSVYRTADVLIFPTLEDVWGLVANEAVLSGLPVLCSKYAGCANELFGAESIFDPENGDEFVSKLQQAVTGQLPKPNLLRLKTTPEILNQLVRSIEISTYPRDQLLRAR